MMRQVGALWPVSTPRLCICASGNKPATQRGRRAGLAFFRAVRAARPAGAGCGLVHSDAQITVFSPFGRTNSSADEQLFSFTKMRHFFIAALHTSGVFYDLILTQSCTKACKTVVKNTKFGSYPVVAISATSAQADTPRSHFLPPCTGAKMISGMSPV